MNKEEMLKVIQKIIEVTPELDMYSMDDMTCVFAWVAIKIIAQEFNYNNNQTEQLEIIMANTVCDFISCISKLSKKED